MIKRLSIATLALAAAAAPAFSHDLSAAHSHIGQTVIMALPPVAILVAAVVAVAAVVQLWRTRKNR